MADVSRRICRLCLEEIPDNNYEDIDEVNREILQILLINIDYDISDNAVVCNRCLEKIQSCFDFKSTCFFVDDYITPFVDTDTKVDIRKVFQKEASKENVNLENYKICRLCMSVIEGEAVHYTTDRKDGNFLEDLIENCLPEVDLNIVLEPLMCKPCLSKLKSYYEFMKTCQEVEERIKNYFMTVTVNHDVTNANILFDLVKNCDTTSEPRVIKTEHSDVNIDVLNRFKNEGTVSIENDEIVIKDETNRVDLKETSCSEDVNSSGKINSSRRKVRKRTNKGPAFFCPKCPYSANIRYLLEAHTRTHSENEVHRCGLCSFVTDSRLSLKGHMSSHRGPTKAFGCRECPFETSYKNSLQQHIITHKDKSEVEMHECPSCPYKNKYKSILMSHRKRNHGRNIQMYQCERCSFSTKHKSSLISHQLIHMKPEGIHMYRCEKCKFETKYRMNLVNHMLIHADPKLANIFKCEKCPYRSKKRRDITKHKVVHSDKHPYSCDECTYSSNFKENLRRHKRVHQKDGEREMYGCKLCSYQARTTVSIKDHMMRSHTDPSELPKLKCTQCNYETTLKKFLSRHMARVHETDRPILNCSQCLYVTTQKELMQSHLLTHQEATIQCDQCNFRTRHKSYMRIHIARHDPSIKRSILKCDKCEYCTTAKTALKAHQVTHMEVGETTAYNCATCNFQTKYKGNLKDHMKHCRNRKRKVHKKK